MKTISIKSPVSMEILSPSTYVFDCKCKCGAHFIATEKDFTTRNIRVIDEYASTNDAYGNVYGANFSVLECPFCERFAVKDYSNLQDIEKAYNNKNSKILFKHDVRPFTLEDQDLYDEVDVEVKKWTEVPSLVDKYPFGLAEMKSESTDDMNH